MKSILFPAIFLLAQTSAQYAFAAEPVTPGNVLQPSCDFPTSLYDIRSVGVLTSGEGNVVKNKKVSTGKSIATGDVIFYAQLEKSRTSYSTKKDAQIQDKSPITPDMKIDANRKYSVWGNLTMNGSGKKFALLDIRGYALAVVNENGFLCSEVIRVMKNEFSSVGMPQAYQEVPFEKLEEPVGDGNTTAIAMTLKEFDAVSFTIDLAVLKNGKVLSRKAIGFDLISGQANVGGLVVEVEADGKSALKIKSIVEPLDFSIWMKQIFNI